jgi:hypothetical protein
MMPPPGELEGQDCLAADIIAEAAHLITLINRYRLALLDPDAFQD